jgi:hypothetical protein
MNFNQKHERYVNNLDGAYESLLAAREKEIYEDEIIKDWILSDEVAFQRYAAKWLEDPDRREEFLIDAVKYARDERTPQWHRAWEDDPYPINRR